MKVFVIGTLCSVLVTSSLASSRHISQPHLVKNVLRNARRLENENNNNGQNNQGDNKEGVQEVEELLMNFDLKLLKCEGDESLGANDEGIMQYGVAIVRACPRDSCNSQKQGGCTQGHADFALPLADFVEAYLQDADVANNYNQDAENLAECVAFESEGGNNNNNNNNNNAQYYVGPACTKDGKDIRLGLFTDEYCQRPLEEDHGWELPYADGGLISKECLSCGERNGDDDNAQLQLKEMCATFYEDAQLKCEEWDIDHYYWDAITEVYRYGKDTTGCKRIAWMDKSPEPFSEWLTIFVLALMVVGSIAGAIYYTMWWNREKESLEKIDDAYHQQGDDASHASTHTGASSMSGADKMGFFSGWFA